MCVITFFFSHLFSPRSPSLPLTPTDVSPTVLSVSPTPDMVTVQEVYRHQRRNATTILQADTVGMWVGAGALSCNDSVASSSSFKKVEDALMELPPSLLVQQPFVVSRFLRCGEVFVEQHQNMDSTINNSSLQKADSDIDLEDMLTPSQPASPPPSSLVTVVPSMPQHGQGDNYDIVATSIGTWPSSTSSAATSSSTSVTTNMATANRRLDLVLQFNTTLMPGLGEMDNMFLAVIDVDDVVRFSVRFRYRGKCLGDRDGVCSA